jgi:MoaA/NifB/PqqE/SkfB family radical SAM enzyme
VSIDGAQAATHDEQRGVAGSFARAVGAIRLMRAYALSIGVSTPIIIKPTVSALNLAEMPALVELAADLDCSILFQPVSDWGTPETGRLWINDLERLEQIVDALIRLRQAGHPVMNSVEQMRDWSRHFQRVPRVPSSGSVKCTVALDTLIILANGELRHCYTKSALGKAGSAAIQDLWRSQGAREVRAESMTCDRGCTDNCTVMRPISQMARGVFHLIRST